MQRTPEFDALRGLAALAIVVLHLWFPSCTPLSTGLNLFFVLSGFLITSIILRNLDAENFLSAFYARRALRIWPIYYLSLLAVLAFNVVSPVPNPTDGLPYFLTYTQNLPAYWGAKPPPFILSFLHTWTLAIEEQFYIVWPLMLYVAGRRALVPLAVTFLATAVVARALGVHGWILLTQCDGLACGSLLAALLSDPDRVARHRRRLGGLFLALAVAGVGFTLKGAAVLGAMGGAWVPVAASAKVFFTNLFYFSLLGGVVLGAGGPALRPLRGRGLTYLGQISYGIYLYHYIVIITMVQLFRHFGLARNVGVDALAFALVIGLAVLSWRYVEQPILGLKDRFGYGVRSSPDYPSRTPGGARAPLRPVPGEFAARGRGVGPR